MATGTFADFKDLQPLQLQQANPAATGTFADFENLQPLQPQSLTGTFADFATMQPLQPLGEKPSGVDALAAEQEKQRKIQEFITQTATEVEAYESQFDFSERMKIRLARGELAGVANSLIQQISKTRNQIGAWKRGDMQSQPLSFIDQTGVRRYIQNPLALPPGLTEDQAFELAITQAEQGLVELEREQAILRDAIRNPTIQREVEVQSPEGRPRSVREIREQQKQKQFELINVPTHPAMLALQAAGGDADYENAILQEFFPEVIAEVGLGSITQAGWKQLLIPGGVAATAKALTGSTLAARAAFMAGTGSVSGVVEQQNAFAQYLMEEEKIDLRDENKVAAALENPDIIKRASEHAFKRGLGVAFWDAIGAGIASKKVLPPVFKKKIVQNLMEFGTQLIAQGATGAAGELQAQLFEGKAPEDFNMLEAKLEFAGEFFTAPLELATFALAEKVGKPASELLTVTKLFEVMLEHPELELKELAATFQELSNDVMNFDDALLLISNLRGESGASQIELERALRPISGDQTFIGYGSDDLPGVTNRDILDPMLFIDSETNSVEGKDILLDAPSTDSTSNSNQKRTVYFQSPESATSTITTFIKSKYDQIAKENVKLQEAITNGDTFTEDYIRETIKSDLQQIAALQRREEEWKIFHAQYKDLIQNFWRKYGQGNLMVVDQSPELAARESGSYGAFSLHVNPDGGKTGILFMSPGRLTRFEDLGVRDIHNAAPEAYSTGVSSVLIHELGHAIAIMNWSTLPQEVRLALVGAHRKYLRDLADKYNKDEIKNMKDFYLTKKNVAGLEAVYSNWFLKADVEEYLNPKYDYNFDEFMADMTSRAASRPGTIPNTLVRRVAKAIAARMESFFKEAAPYNSQDETFDKFLRYIELKNNIEAINSIQQTLTEHELTSPVGSQAEKLNRLLTAKELEIPKELQDKLKGEADRYNWVVKHGLTLLQLGKENPHIKGLQDYIDSVHQHWITKSTWNDQGMRTINAWRKLGRKNQDELGRLMLLMTLQSDEIQGRLSNEDLEALIERENISFGGDEAKVWEVYTQIKDDLSNALEQLYLIEKNRINHDYADFDSKRKAMLQSLDYNFDQIRNRDYFPLSRFGEYTLTLKATKEMTYQGKSYKKGDVVWFEIFENERQRNKAQGKLMRDIRNVKPELNKLDDTVKQFTGLPSGILRNLRDNPRLLLDDLQKEQINNMIDRLSLTNNIAKRMLHRKGTPGFSLDAMRGYAYYMMSMGAHIARELHTGQMDEAISLVDASASTIGKEGKSNTKRVEIAAHLRRHRDYILNPENEWGGLRTLAFHWFLGYNPHSAFVNLAQVPLVSFPYLAARKELTGNIPAIADAKAAAALIKAMHDVKFLFEHARSKYNSDETEMFSVLQSEGIIDESLATEIAGQAHADAIQRIMPGANIYTDRARQVGSGILRGSTFMFQFAEKYNRRATALATFRLAKAAGMSNVEAITEAREALRTTQFEYARWNRPGFMRGKKSVLTIFMQYLQNMLYFVGREPGKWRHLGLLLVVAGIQGLPGAEDLMDIFDFGRTWWRRRTLDKDPYSAIREDIRKEIIALDLNPDILMHGLFSESMGLSLPAVSDMLGTSIPAFTLENSLSMGRVIPGVEALTRPTPLSGPSSVEAAKDVLGAAFTIPISIATAMASDDPNRLKSFESALPTILKSSTRALRAYLDSKSSEEKGKEGGLRNRGGDLMYPFDRTNPEHIAELIGMAAGAKPTRLQRRSERDFAQMEALRYYQHLRSIYTNNWVAAYDQASIGDTEALDEALKVIRKFNAVAPKGQQIINPAEALIRREKNKAFYGQGFPDRILDYPASSERDKLYPRATEEFLPR